MSIGNSSCVFDSSDKQYLELSGVAWLGQDKIFVVGDDTAHAAWMVTRGQARVLRFPTRKKLDDLVGRTFPRGEHTAMILPPYPATLGPEERLGEVAQILAEGILRAEN